MQALFHSYNYTIVKILLFLRGSNIIHCYNGIQDIQNIKGINYNLLLNRFKIFFNEPDGLPHY